MFIFLDVSHRSYACTIPSLYLLNIPNMTMYMCISVYLLNCDIEEESYARRLLSPSY